MLIVVFLFALIRTLQGAPLFSPVDVPAGLPTLSPREIESHIGSRTVTDIVISCFATIFACTWTAIHPNIPAPTDCWWAHFKRQVTTMLYALLAPELITYWALRQRIGAKHLMNEYNKEILGDPQSVDSPDRSILDKIKGIPTAIRDGIKRIPDMLRRLFHDSPMPEPSPNGPRWTLAHGFFLQMGGFMLSEHGRPIHTLRDGTQTSTTSSPSSTTPDTKSLIYNIKEGVIDRPRITEEDIRDRGKGDAIAKTFIILQTAWFIVQCIARWTQHLHVTELEVITLGFAILNGTTYALWWHKPQNVGRPVFLECKTSLDASDDSPIPSNAADPSVQIIDQTSEKGSKSMAADEKSVPPQSIHKRKSWISQMLHNLWAVKWNAMWKFPFLIVWNLLHALLRPLRKMLSPTEIADASDDYRVPMFYAATTPQNPASVLLILIASTVFGCVHLLPSWFLDFSSRQEMLLWRVCALIITAEPLFFGVSAYVFAEPKGPFEYLFARIFGLPTLLGAFLYPFLRVILFFIALASLRSPAPAALKAIEWNTFIPHI